ncbi:radical SAM family heme chaperone HemW [Flavobacteriaceae bacterium]|nr:radical SAM family heme chaperone HemW [Flavobacteriaceae bacterium]MDA9025476.1 radical SAM family heme chaperone HemW [bacterium]MDB9994475.1 radical SAM family heme chaperone HemW [Flavobacteriaceae bacterium]
MAGIYIHIPFCKQACHYCDFHFSTSTKKKNELLAAICSEIELRKSEISVPIKTIYFGGGTPSLLNKEEIDLLIGEVYKNFEVEENIEVTLEANPDDLTKGNLYQLSKTKVNRLSIGVQSFFEEDLTLMNRAHNALEAKQCLTMATQYFDNISVDLIYGIPGLDDNRWEESLDTIIAFGIPHVSCYALTVEPKTVLKKLIKNGKIAPVSEINSHRQYLILLDKMKKEGYVNYEFSNFGKQGYFSENNTAYWQGKSYLGLGPSAHSFDGNIRSWNISNNIQYINQIQIGKLPIKRETLSKTDRYNEYLMTGLRTMCGVSLNKVKNNFGTKYLDYLLEQTKIPINDGLLEIVLAKVVKPSINSRSSSSSKKEEFFSNDSVLIISEKGKFLSDGIASNLFMVE